MLRFVPVLKGVNHPAWAGQSGAGTTGSVRAPAHSLFNGNIGAWTSKTRQELFRPPGNLPSPDPEAVQGEVYRYDQLNRLTSSTLGVYAPASNAFAATDNYATSYQYDPNGNLSALRRNGSARLDPKGPATQLALDELSYVYDTKDPDGANRLMRVNERTPDQPYYAQAIAQTPLGATADQYGYDEIGNLIKDETGGVTNIAWNVYGKIAQVTQTNNRLTQYAYDAQGNRVGKRRTTGIGAALSAKGTYYVRDAQGNVLAVYEQQQTGTQAPTAMRLSEQPLYGSARLGMRTPPATTTALSAGYYQRLVGQKRYELSDHLGNVRAVLGDAKRPSPTTAGAYVPELVAYTGYYAFGLEQPGRTSTGNAVTASGYRYGFNGKEKDNNGELGLTHYDYGFRIYNPGIGRFLSTDPLAKKYPMLTPFQFASNTPIQAIDLDGLEKFVMHLSRVYTLDVTDTRGKQTVLKVPNADIAYRATFSIVYDDGTPPVPLATEHDITVYENKASTQGPNNLNKMKDGHSYKTQWVKYNNRKEGLQFLSDETSGKDLRGIGKYMHVGISPDNNKGCCSPAFEDNIALRKGEIFSAAEDKNEGDNPAWFNTEGAMQEIYSLYLKNKGLLAPSETQGKGAPAKAGSDWTSNKNPHPTPTKKSMNVHVVIDDKNPQQ